MEYMEDILIGAGIPLGICVVLPVLIVWLVTRVSTNRDNKRSQVLIEAIKNNADINADKLLEAMDSVKKSPREIQQKRLLRGCIFSLLGVAFAIISLYFWISEPGSEFITGFVIAAGVLLAIGIAYLIVYYIVRKNKD